MPGESGAWSSSSTYGAIRSSKAMSCPEDFGNGQERFAELVQRATLEFTRRLVEHHDIDVHMKISIVKDMWHQEVAKLKAELKELRTPPTLRNLRPARTFQRLETPEEEEDEAVDDLDALDDRELKDFLPSTCTPLISGQSAVFLLNGSATTHSHPEDIMVPLASSPGYSVMDAGPSRRDSRAGSPRRLIIGSSQDFREAPTYMRSSSPTKDKFAVIGASQQSNRSNSHRSSSPFRSGSSPAKGTPHFLDRNQESSMSVGSVDALGDISRVRPEIEQLLKVKTNKARASVSGNERELQKASASTMQPHSTGSTMRSTTLSQGGCKVFMFSPTSPARSMLDIIGCMMILIASIAYPVMFAWDDLIPKDIEHAVVWSSPPFWTFHMLCSFFQSYYTKDGDIEQRWSPCAKRYLRNGFAFDAITLACDWVAALGEIFVENGLEVNFNAIRLARLVKTSALLRLATVMRVIRLYMMSWRRKMKLSADLSSSGSAALFVLRTMCFLLWLNHLLCCVWFILGETRGDTGISWLDLPLNIDDFMTYRDTGMLYQYTTAMHWSITQMTPGSMQVNAMNSHERIWNIFCVLLGLLISTGLIGQLSSQFVELGVRRRERSRRLERLRNFLDENRISSVIAMRVQKQVEERLDVRRRLTEEDVMDISKLSDALRNRLRQEVFSPYVVWHPLFCLWDYTMPVIIKELCARGKLHFHCLSPGDELFNRETEASSAYLCLKGYMAYILEDHVFSSQNNDEFAKDNSVMVEDGRWMSEASLWLQWKHFGALEARGVCEFMVLPLNGILGILVNHPVLITATMSWAAAFQQMVLKNCLSPSEASHGTAIDPCSLDLFTPMGLILQGMSSDERSPYGRSMMEKLDEQVPKRHMGSFFTTGAKSIADLRDEIEDDKCIVFVDGPQNFYRTVSVMAVQIRIRESGKVVVQVAKRGTGGKASAWVVSVNLPGMKMKPGMEAWSLAESFIQDSLTPLSSHVALEDVGLIAEEKSSQSYGVKSLYMRNVVRASISFAHIEPLKMEHLPPLYSKLNCFLQQDGQGKKTLYGVMSEEELENYQADPSELQKEMQLLMPHLYLLDKSKSSLGRFAHFIGRSSGVASDATMRTTSRTSPFFHNASARSMTRHTPSSPNPEPVVTHLRSSRTHSAASDYASEQDRSGRDALGNGDVGPLPHPASAGVLDPTLSEQSEQNHTSRI